MNIVNTIAYRYLFGKKSTNAINLITGITTLGITIGTAALILILSVFNGFEYVLSGLFNAFNPDLKVELAEGKYLQVSDSLMREVKKIDGIAEASRILEEIALFEYNGSQEAGILKGVDDSYNKVTDIDSTIIRGKYMLSEGSIFYGVLGTKIYNKLSVNPSDAITPISVYMVKRKKSGPLGKDYKSLPLYPIGVFSMGGDEDNQYVLASYEFVNGILDLRDNISSLEIKLKPDGDETFVRAQLEKLMPVKITIKNRYEQDEDYLKIMNIEKWISYLIATLTLLIIAFNMIGALWMIVLDKKTDIAILKSLGFQNKDVQSIFSRVGLLIGLIGLTLGIILALILYVLQKKYGIVGVPSGFMIEAYPIALKFKDFVVVIITVLAIALLASIFPARKAAQSGILLKGK
ncbi:MAG TPA: FtsX-like permease family protein, partial [Saprospiraceae bacterium]|nr:FtsX-like permease family protein [Saprospiraceae bacterium]MCB9327998.1 FtsX-like permease family protein [Lewinellaceae bacterium]HPQ20674.1 FtsX-like permease family protein [Saprospiraceae bacterium]HRX28025.1 FtsX-like permease family protein [Saprospiraceae bacterium]